MSYLFDQLKSVDEKPTEEDKILLMGLQAAGKTAIKDVVFFNKVPEDVEDYMATIHYERQYLDEDSKNLIIDSGGQESYWNEAVTHFRHLVFSNVKLLLWIVDATRPDLLEESERRFSFTIRQYKKENPDGNICVLCHKVDLITPEELVPILDHVKEIFDDPKYDIRFEATSIYYTESLKELVFKLMQEADMNIDRFELVSNVGKKVEESDEFKSYMLEHQGDPRVQELANFLNPKAETVKATFGDISEDVDLSEYDIVEIVLIDKETLSPVFGTSSPSAVNIENSMDYLVALKEFKEIVREGKLNGDSDATVISSSNEKVHALVFNMESNFLLLTSFQEITDEKTNQYYTLINAFAKTLGKDKTLPEKEITLPTTAQETVTEVEAPIEKPVIPESQVEQEITKPIAIDEPAVKEESPDKIIEDSKKIKFSFLQKREEERKKRALELGKQKQKEEAMAQKLAEQEAQTPSVEPPIITEEKIAEKTIEKTPTVVPPQTETTTQIEESIVKEEEIKKEEKEKIEKVIEEQPEVSEQEEVKTEEKPPVKATGGSTFMKRLKEESRRYKIRQIKLQKIKEEIADEKLDLTEDDIEELVKFLKEKSSKE